MSKTVSQKKYKALIIAGPTASGKSSLAMDIAGIYPSTIINADSQQVYKELSILSARPSVDDERATPHALFGVLGADEVCSVGRWLELVKPALEQSIENGQIPILVGGTGLYIKALIEGLSPIPEVSRDARAAARALWEDVGQDEFLKKLAELDQLSASRIAPTDSQRLIRAYEVSLFTHRPFSSWKDEPKIMPFAQFDFLTIQLLPERDTLYAKINQRFDQMVENGALSEVKNLLKLGLAADLPAMKALGVPQLASHIRGEISLDLAGDMAKTASRNYAKRQLTWARHQVDGQSKGKVLTLAQYSESSKGKIFSFIDEFMLTENP